MSAPFFFQAESKVKEVLTINGEGSLFDTETVLCGAVSEMPQLIIIGDVSHQKVIEGPSETK